MNNEFNGFNTDFSLKGKVAAITGGAAGIGHAIAELFIAKGAKVVLLDRADDVAAVAGKLDSRHAAGFYCDVSNAESVKQGVDQAIRAFGQLDILVNSAGIVALDPAEDTTEQDWDRTIAVNLKGVFLTSQCAGQHFIQQGHGKIVNLASQAGVVALPNHLAYCTSKAGVIGMTKVLALEWGPKGVQINAISPTVVLTELGRKAWSGQVAEEMKQLIPARRFAYPPEIAACALFLASDAADMITGANLVIDGGYTIQ
ncbi:SDR family oxidoreductase [Pragia fontium]|uniref:SDR family oxidoreductase n=1 Tax=Pragia fontium TaxID=82985 RepID=UPI000E0261F7|nr:D-threitol dehydrogenase [Pragia fontium]SUB81369.1 Glucose 1-dehydrogenase 2 [Pragia fontium]VEJ53587.1 Glucose 1-dehydrogenase 2 [Pragia fontium]